LITAVREALRATIAISNAVLSAEIEVLRFFAKFV